MLRIAVFLATVLTVMFRQRGLFARRLAACILLLLGTYGAIAVGREADISIFDVVDGNWKFTDTVNQVFTGSTALVPIQTLRAGELFSPEWGPYAWGWLPPEA